MLVTEFYNCDTCGAIDTDQSCGHPLRKIDHDDALAMGLWEGTSYTTQECAARVLLHTGGNRTAAEFLLAGLLYELEDVYESGPWSAQFVEEWLAR